LFWIYYLQIVAVFTKKTAIPYVSFVFILWMGSLIFSFFSKLRRIKQTLKKLKQSVDWIRPSINTTLENVEVTRANLEDDANQAEWILV
jgi:hypothetical protein